MKLEQSQRERRAKMEEVGENHVPKWFIKQNPKSNTWTFNETYWNQRIDPGFSKMNSIELW